MAAAGRLCALLCLALAAGAAALGKRSPVKVLSDGMWRELLQGEWMVELWVGRGSLGLPGPGGGCVWGGLSAARSEAAGDRAVPVSDRLVLLPAMPLGAPPARTCSRSGRSLPSGAKTWKWILPKWMSRSSRVRVWRGWLCAPKPTPRGFGLRRAWGKCSVRACGLLGNKQN